MISPGELASMQRDVLPAMPDTATILRNTPTSGPGGYGGDYTAFGTTPCRLVGLSAPIEASEADEFASVTHWKLVVPTTTTILPRDRIECNTRTFEVQGGLADDTWNITNAFYLVEVLR